MGEVLLIILKIIGYIALMTIVSLIAIFLLDAIVFFVAYYIWRGGVWLVKKYIWKRGVWLVKSINRMISRMNMCFGFYLHRGKEHDGWTLVEIWFGRYAYVRYDIINTSRRTKREWTKRKYLSCNGEKESKQGSIFIYAEDFSEGLANVREDGKPADTIDCFGRSLGELGFFNKSGTIGDHDYVDLGLSVKWATCNVGASKPEDYGDYYAWGETEKKESYNVRNCETWEKDIDDIGGTDHDVAHVKWGGTWRLPTKDEIEELIDNCGYKCVNLNGVVGYKFTSRKNGESIFLPAAGWRYGTSLDRAFADGYYWSSTPDDGSARSAFGHVYTGMRSKNCCWHNRTGGYGYLWSSMPCSRTQSAYNIYFGFERCCYMHWDSRIYGQTVRPVSE